MIQPKPFKVKCQNCEYSKVIRPKSDVFTPLDAMRECPKCAHKMKRVELNALENILNFPFL